MIDYYDLDSKTYYMSCGVEIISEDEANIGGDLYKRIKVRNSLGSYHFLLRIIKNINKKSPHTLCMGGFLLWKVHQSY